MSNIVRREDILKHFGTKGMKWGVHRKTESKPKKSISYLPSHNTFPKKTLLKTLNGLQVPAPVAAAIYAGDAFANAKTKKRILKAFNSKASDFDRRELKEAAKLVRNYTGIKLKVDKKIVTME